MEIKKVCVLGAGVMGHGIAQVYAQTGYEVSLRDIEDKFVQGGLNRIRKFLNGSVERKKMTREEADATLSRIKGTTDLKEAAKDVDLVIEAVVEDMQVKKDVFKELDSICPPHTILASNTSQLCITEMATATKRPGKVLGMHWMNPPQIMRGIEVIKTEKTSQETLDIILDQCKKLGREVVVCKDSPGFVGSRILQSWRNESFRLFDEGVTTPKDIDTAWKIAYNFRMGPFELADLVGIDILVHAGEGVAKEIRPEIFKPPRCLVMKFKAGDFGRKTGRGFYQYEG